MKKALIFANGKRKDGIMVHRALDEASDASIIVADGGVRIALKYNLVPDAIIGDMDSVDHEILKQLEATGVVIQHYPQEKNETDLELALSYAAEHGAQWIRIIGGIGGRFDQMLANVYLLALPQLANRDVAIVAGKQSICLLREGENIVVGQEGDTVSLIPISGDVCGITTYGLKYALQNDTLLFGPARGVSNVLLGDTAKIIIDTGYLLCVHTVGNPD